MRSKHFDVFNSLADSYKERQHPWLTERAAYTLRSMYLNTS